jgi:hypothetical protein
MENEMKKWKQPAKVVIEAVPEVNVEDGGCAKIAEICEDDNQDNGVFVRFQSWSEEHNHDLFDKFIGKKVRVTIEVCDG